MFKINNTTTIKDKKSKKLRGLYQDEDTKICLFDIDGQFVGWCHKDGQFLRLNEKYRKCTKNWDLSKLKPFYGSISYEH